jgi:hypothetical protein
VIALAVLSATLLLLSLKLPLWQLRMEAPQYRDDEALKVAVYPGAMRGDLNEIKVLNQYIGVHIPDELPQLEWLPTALVATGVVGLLAAFMPAAVRRRALALAPAALSLALLVAAVQAQWQMYDIGHKRDQKTKLARFKDFTAPLLGSAKIAQFKVSSRFGPGAGLVAAAIVLQFAGAWLNRRSALAPSRLADREQASPEETINPATARKTPAAVSSSLLRLETSHISRN